MGDEWHYLVKCGNQNISNIRTTFVEQIVTIQPQLKDFETHTLMHYCVSLQDTSTQLEAAKFVKELLQAYSDEKEKMEEENGTCSIM